MIRNLKALGLALVAVFAMSAVAASGAQAAHFAWAEGTTTLNGSAEANAGGIQKFTTSVGTFECNSVTASASVSGLTSETVTTNSITYNNSGSADECPASLGTAHISMNGCNYKFHAGATVGESTTETSGTVDVICPTNPIEINVSGLCLVKVGSQTGLGPVIYKTIAGSPSTVTIEPKVTNITWTSSGLCGTHGDSKGTYTGNVIVKGENELAEQTAVSVT
jgi:hypothetical protein